MPDFRRASSIQILRFAQDDRCLFIMNFRRLFNLLRPEELQVQVVNEAFDGVHGLWGEEAGGAEEGCGVAVRFFDCALRAPLRMTINTRT